MRPTLLLLFQLVFGGVVIFISCKKEYSCETCAEKNKPPIAIAAPDQVITLPTDSIALDGSASSDPDGKISKWLWKKISGPASFAIANSSVAKTKAKNLVAGTYQFELTVTDDKGASAKDTMMVTVDATPTPKHPPVANGGADQTTTLPTNTANLDGSASTDPDNNITSYHWTKISGPPSFDISNANSVQTQVNNLAEGTYEFELEVTDADGLFGRDTIKVFVLAAPVVLSPPVSGDVYVAGFSEGKAVYWKNAIPVVLTRGMALGITVSGSDVFVAGAEYDGTTWSAKYWKNGTPVTLRGGSIATSIAVSGTDVYVAGYEYNNGNTSTAKYWKNGVPIVLTDGSQQAEARAIAVSGSDVYVAGVEQHDNYKFARYWKNGTLVSLPNGNNWAEANDIAISGSDIYVAGSVGGETVYWKNGNYVNLSGISNAFLAAYGIAISGSDVYVAGLHDISLSHDSDFGTATYWKNEVYVSLSSIVFSGAGDIAVSGNDIYVAGYENQKALYWKNGTSFTLSSNGAALSIVVIP